jgi:ATP/ADP translocase
MDDDRHLRDAPAHGPALRVAFRPHAAVSVAPDPVRIFQSQLGPFFAAMTSDLSPQWAARTFFVWLSVFNLFVVSVFWSVMADLFTPTQGARLFGVIAAGGSIGAMVARFSPRG